MAITAYPLLIDFLVGMIVSAAVIFIATTLFNEKEGFGTALLAAFIGAIIYATAYYFFGNGISASILGGFAWLLALSSLYNMGWIKAFVVALVIWLIAALVGLVLPSMVGHHTFFY